MTCLQKDITIKAHQGVHGRVATELAMIVQKYDVLMHILYEDDELDCASVLDVLSMGFVSGTSVRFRVQGDNASRAMKEVEKVLRASQDQ